MNERFIYLLEKYFENELLPEEKIEFNSLLENDEELKKEFSEQKKVKEVLSKMSLKNPTNEFWDKYWMSTYNRLERGIAWIVISVGAIILFTYAALEAIEQFFADNSAPIIIKIGIATLIVGFVMLLFSLFREKIFNSAKDKYKEIQR
ncbi:MAG: ferric reductase-like transmembrane domain-containing protein [Melioribacteraceae bacterium]|nr:ferric reductase-like transmembrane domain-containing protein [Melioribacteraceae bacterium]